ncbi:hypothetical protein ASE93_15525 [Serratia sp. Leaf50]|nr:hypothetical protein ASE93_15525 [Serratia sp. Leaf50]
MTNKSQVAELIDIICLTAAEIHNHGHGVSNDKAQDIIEGIRARLEPVYSFVDRLEAAEFEIAGITEVLGKTILGQNEHLTDQLNNSPCQSSKQ